MNYVTFLVHNICTCGVLLHSLFTSSVFKIGKCTKSDLKTNCR